MFQRLNSLWLRVPEPAFRLLGAAFFLSYVGLELRRGWESWPALGFYYVANGRIVHLPWVTVLVDLSMLSIALGYVVRRAPRERATGFGRVVLPFVAAFWPMAPFFLRSLAAQVARTTQAAWAAGFSGWITAVMTPSELPVVIYLASVGLIGLGNLLDIWSYFTLRRSLSIVAEARELVTGGPYRWIRHPIYAGQFIAQAGVWLGLQAGKPWCAIYFAAFVVMQLVRARIEDRVLTDAFGERYAEWKRRAKWFD